MLLNYKGFKLAFQNYQKENSKNSEKKPLHPQIERLFIVKKLIILKR